MQEHCSRQVEMIAQQALRELAAHLTAIHDHLGCNDLITCGDRWIETMKSLEWPDDEYEKFFRRVSIHSIVWLLHDNPASTRPDAKHMALPEAAKGTSYAKDHA
jgi:hypothetical protein